MLKLNQSKICNGYCFDYLKKHLKMIYAEDKINKDGKFKFVKELEPRICTEEDVGPDLI